MTVKQGDTVTVWRSDESGFPHNVQWGSGDICPANDSRWGGAWSCPRTFGKVGTFQAVCTLHGAMTLTVTVLAGPTPPPATPKPTPKPTPKATPKPTPKPTKKPTPPPTQAPADRTPSPTVGATPTAAATATVPPSASPTVLPSPSPVIAAPASTATPAPIGTVGSDGTGPFLLLLGLAIAGALGGAALVRHRASAPGRSAEA